MAIIDLLVEQKRLSVCLVLAAHSKDYQLIWHNGYLQVADANGQLLNRQEMGVFNSLMGK